MEKQLAFHILGLEETKEEQKIQNAYRGLLRQTNPEDDPEGFKRLREAYETALSWARQPEAAEEGEKTEIQAWIDRVDQVYKDIHDRCQPDAWKEVLDDPICEDLDTSLQAREAMMAYLMDHIYLPNRIWRLLDTRFQIIEDREALGQQFPADFLNYVVHYIENQEFINYSLFEVLDEEGADADAYIRNYLGVKRMIDQGQMEDGQAEECKKRLKELRAFGIYHPYEDVETLRILYSLIERANQGMPEGMKAEDTPGGREAVRLTAHLLEEYGGDSYILLHCGAAKWALGQEEEADDLWNQVLEQYPAHYMAKFYISRYLMKKGEYRQAKDRLLELVDMDDNDKQVIQMLHEANDALMDSYRNKMAGEDYDESGRYEDTLELARCCYQNEHIDEAVDLLQSLTPDEEQEYDYENLIGRVFYRGERYEEAFPHLKHWLELIRRTLDDKTEENTKRRSREFRACHILSGCCHEMGDKDAALDYVE